MKTQLIIDSNDKIIVLFVIKTGKYTHDGERIMPLYSFSVKPKYDYTECYKCLIKKEI